MSVLWHTSGFLKTPSAVAARCDVEMRWDGRLLPRRFFLTRSQDLIYRKEKKATLLPLRALCLSPLVIASPETLL